MADDDQNLVSNIEVTGGEEATAEVEKFADDSAEALERLGDAAEDASKKVEKSTDNIGKGFKKVKRSAKDVGDSSQDFARAGLSLKALEDDTRAFTASIPKAAKEITQFVKKLAVLATAAAASGIAVVAAARNVAKAVDGQSDSLDKQTNAQIDANNAALQGELAQIQYESSMRQLNKQLATGAVTYLDYIRQVRELNANFKEQQRVAREVEDAQRRVKEENERLTKQLADRKAYNQLIDTLGGPLTTSLTALGRVAEQIRKKIVDTFGPGVAAVIDAITNTLDKNSGAIGKFFDNAAKKIQDLITQNGPALQRLFENIGRAAGAVFNALIDAAPTLLDIFNNKIVPAVESVASALDTLAKIINNIFGTNITGAFIAIVIVLGTMTDAFKALFSVSGLVVRGFAVLVGVVAGALGTSLLAAAAIVGVVAAALYLLFTQVDWAKWGQMAVDAWTAITNGSNTAVQAIKSAWGAITGWFQSTIITPITTFFTTLWTAVQTGFGVVAQFFRDTWGAIVAFFTETNTSIQEAFNTAINTIKGYWSSAVDSIKGYFSDLLAAANSYLKPIIDLIKQIISLAAQAASSETAAGAAGGGQFAGGGRVRGPGTSTSDSIPAWLSNGEFVIRAAAVRKYGSAFMHAINSGRFRDGGLALATGGMAQLSPASPASAHRAAAGGSRTSGMSPLNLTLFGEQFDGLMMPEDVGRRLTKFAIKKQTASAGRKPSWVGGGRT